MATYNTNYSARTLIIVTILISLLLYLSCQGPIAETEEHTPNLAISANRYAELVKHYQHLENQKKNTYHQGINREIISIQIQILWQIREEIATQKYDQQKGDY